jgi:hypothetical protein
MNVFIEDIVSIKNEIKIINNKVDDLINKINFIFFFKKGEKKKKQKQKEMLNNFTYSSTEESDYSTDSECGCNKEPQKEDKEISDYIKRIMIKNENNHNCSCGCGREFF